MGQLTPLPITKTTSTGQLPSYGKIPLSIPSVGLGLGCLGVGGVDYSRLVQDTSDA